MSGSSTRARPPNVVLVVLDAARAKNLGIPEGGRRATTPNLDRLASGGTRFLRAVAPGNWTVPSHMSILTGTYPSQHGLRTFLRGPPRLPTIASWLMGQRYQTGVFSEAVHLTGGYGLEQGYERQVSRYAGLSDEERTFANRISRYTRFIYGAKTRQMLTALPPVVFALNAFNYPQELGFKRAVTSDYLLPAFEEWLKGRDPDRPFHALVNFVDCHEPYPGLDRDPPLSWAARQYARTPRFFLLSVPELSSHVPWSALEGGYLRGLERADAKLGRVLSAIDSVGESDRTVMIVTSDHGQSFGEGGNVYHGCGATDSIARIPLVVRAPMFPDLPPVVSRWTTACDIASWMKAVALTRPPFDEDGYPTGSFPISPPDSEFIFCEGGPASDPNRSLGGVRPECSWNHRLIAAYSAEEKWVLDLVDGSIHHWSDLGAADVGPGELLPPAVAKVVRQRVFSRYENAPGAVAIPTDAYMDRPALEDERMRSWGYD
ncbi:MAG: sulfatase [Thermoplasmata archaeon]|nr:sulfatase [Thermoplasmata archaeon]